MSGIESNLMETVDLGSSTLSKTERIEDSAYVDEEPVDYITENGDQTRLRLYLQIKRVIRPRKKVFAPSYMQTGHIGCSKMEVYKDGWVTIKGYLCHAKTNMVRLDSHVTLLNKYNYRSERKCNEFKATISTLSMEDREAARLLFE